MAYLTTTGLGACSEGQTIGPDGTCSWAGSNPGASPLLAYTGRYAPSPAQCAAVQSGAVSLTHGAPGMPAASQQLLSDCANSGYTTPSAPIAAAPTHEVVASAPVFTGAAAVPQGGFVPAFSFVGDNPQAYAQHVGLRGLGNGCACGCKSKDGLSGMCGCKPGCRCGCNGSSSWGPADWLVITVLGWIGYELFFKPAPVVLIQEVAD
jgi:hypothetical protein